MFSFLNVLFIDCGFDAFIVYINMKIILNRNIWIYTQLNITIIILTNVLIESVNLIYVYNLCIKRLVVFFKINIRQFNYFQKQTRMTSNILIYYISHY